MLSYILTKTSKYVTGALCFVLLYFSPWVKDTKVLGQHPGDWETLDQEQSHEAWGRAAEFLALHGILVVGTAAYDDAMVPPLETPSNSFSPVQNEDFVHRLKPGTPSKLAFFTHSVRRLLAAFDMGPDIQRFQQGIWVWINMDVTST